MTNYANIRYQPAAASTTTVADMAALIALTGMSNGDQALVQATNKLYMYSGTGWYIIATIQNDAPSAITGVSGTYELAVDGTATTITAASTDPEGFPLTWSYSTSGLGSIATISNTDNVFTITPSTTEADAGAFTLTINATDGINGAVSTTTNLTLNFIVIVTNSRYTTLLATAVDTSDNNNITDASTSNHTITVNGDAYAGTFSPYRVGGYSTYFDGAGDYIDTGLNNAATDFTFECWVNTTVGGMLMARYASGSALDGFIIDSTSGFPVIQINTNANNLNGTVNLKDGKWHHLAFVRDSNVCKIFVDGILDVSQTDSEAMQVNANWIIGRHGNNASYYYGGYIRDLRWAAGTVRYTSNFTPPTEPLTALSGDNLFTCHLPYIVDGSSTPYTMTSYGNVSTKPFSPYDYDEYDAADHGGSVYFDGTGDYLTILHNTTLNMGNGSWTAEMWIYPDGNYTTYNTLFAKRLTPVGSTIEYEGYLTPTNGYLGYIGPSGSLQTSTATPITKTWNHVAYVYDGTNIEIFLNGVSVLDQATSSQDTTADLYIGCYNRAGVIYDYYYGYMSDFKLSKGQTTYTATFTPPIAPLSSSGTTLHIKGTDASIIDKSQGDNLKLVGNTTGSTTQVKFAGSKSMYFDGTGDYVSISEDDKFNISGDFTIESWIWPSNSTLSGIFSTGNGSFSSNAVVLTWRHGTVNDQFSFWVNNISSSSQILTSNIASTNTWTHIAIVRLGNTITLYQNGTSVDTYTSSGTFNLSHNGLKIGSYWSGTFNGYIQDFRITNGLARYTANFTPPTASLEG
jgi:hypothetical protein